MTKQEILDYFSEIDFMYNHAGMHDDLSRMLDKLLENRPEQKFFIDSDGKITPLPIQKHGTWIPIKTPTGVKHGGVEEYTVQEVMCSECGFTDDVSASIYTYCPECGAKMDGR